MALEHGVRRDEHDLWAYHSQMKHQEAPKAEEYTVGEELMAVEIP